MARPKKKGLDYFPLDVDIFEDDKLFDVQNEYGPLGEVIYIRLLCLVYKNGYYYQFDSLDKLAALMIRSIGNRWTRDKKTVKDVISYLAKINLFSSELMQRNILTSRSIQERYLLAVERRQSKITDFNLLEKNQAKEGLINAPQNQINVTETPINETETLVNADNNGTKESKENKSKVNERKEESIFSDLNILQRQYNNLVSMSDSSSVNNYIDKIILWQNKSGKYCRNPYQTIKCWIEQDKRSQSNKDTSYDIDQWEDFALNFDPTKGGCK